jgi:predicted phage terminase large subunit-like protein
MRHIKNPNFGAVIFRRNTTQVRNEGGLFDASMRLYPYAGGIPKESTLEWKFPAGSKIKFAHLEHDSTVLSYQGAEIPAILYDELVHFSKSQFMYMLSRNRSTCGIKPYVRATTNPDADSWVREWVDWYIDNNTGLPIPERSGVKRWFIILNDKMIWANSKREILEQYPNSFPKSFTFISANIFDNKKLLEVNPEYLSNLHALPTVERERLLNGNWNIKPSAGLYFKRSFFKIVDEFPKETIKVRYWDRASTQKTDTNDPDYTVGLKLEKTSDNIFYVTDLVRIQETPLNVQKAIKNTAILDGYNCTIGLEQDPGQAGVSEIDFMVRQLTGYAIKVNKVSTDKITRALPVSSQAEAGNIYIVKGNWNQEFFRELENFPDGKHDDIIDSLSGAFNLLSQQKYRITDLGRW